MADDVASPELKPAAATWWRPSDDKSRKSTTMTRGRVDPHRISYAAGVVSAAGLLGAATVLAGSAAADNSRFNNSVIADVYKIQRDSGCTGNVHADGSLQAAAQRHAADMLSNRDINGDSGSDGSTPQERSAQAGFRGRVAETVAINPALAMSGIELLNQWYYDPAYYVIMSDCANTSMGVWSENSLDRTVVVALYGQPESR